MRTADFLGAKMTTLASGIEHLHSSPSWNCRTCEQPWPCARARANLTEEFRDFPSVLTVYMAAQMHEALTEIIATTGQAPPDLYTRFLAWIRHSLPAPTTTGGTTQSSTPQLKAAAAKSSGQTRYGTTATANRTTAAA